MTTAYPDDLVQRLVQWTVDHRAAYLRSGGVEGHIMDMSFIDGLPLQTMCLIRYVGRKSGRVMVNGLGYTLYGAEIVIVGSKGGSDEHPQWYKNIKAGSPLAIQIATQAYDASWREPDDAEYERIWETVERQIPPMAVYRQSTARKIPLVLVSTHKPVPVFTEPD